MVFGSGISLPTIEGTQVLLPVRIVAAWIALILVSHGIGSLIYRSKRWIASVTRINPLTWFNPIHEQSDDAEDKYTVAALKERLDWERRWRRRKARGIYRSVVVAPVIEELIYRGGPFLLALTLGGYRLPLLVAGSLIWAHKHTRNPFNYTRTTAPVFVHGLLMLYLWMVGLWWVGVLVHAGNNAFAMMLRVGMEWWQRHQRTFTPGDEYQVMVDDHAEPPQPDGLCRALTQAGDILHVANVEPDETTRVRVAANIGDHSYAFPIANPPEKPSEDTG